ncbi:MAG: Mrp/NBP35 family ATP-binding protein [Methanophagales archaeon]|nr:Mrp/NBP35 family ATP-binding protein [Methanophagales archaeon]
MVSCIVVASGKGGVGKSTIAASIAQYIAMKGLRTGLIDLDVDSPSVPMITGTKSSDIGISGSLLEPAVSKYGLKVFSVGHLLPSDDTPILWEGERKERFLMDVFRSCNFSDVECLVIDLPPGTGDELYGVSSTFQSAAAVVVTLPQQLSLISVKKAIRALKRYNIRILGIIENMSGLQCPKCGSLMYPFEHGAGKMVAEANGIEFLGEVPIMPDVSREADRGSVETIVNSDVFKSIGDRIIEKMGLLPQPKPAQPITTTQPASLSEEIAEDIAQMSEGDRAPRPKAKGEGTGVEEESVSKKVKEKKDAVIRITATIKEEGKKRRGRRRKEKSGQAKERETKEMTRSEEEKEREGEKEVK